MSFNLLDLPHDVFFHVFSFLPSDSVLRDVQLTCKPLQQLVKHPNSFTQFVFSGKENVDARSGMTSRAAQVFLKQHPRITAFSAAGMPNVSPLAVLERALGRDGGMTGLAFLEAPIHSYSISVLRHARSDALSQLIAFRATAVDRCYNILNLGSLLHGRLQYLDIKRCEFAVSEEGLKGENDSLYQDPTSAPTHYWRQGLQSRPMPSGSKAYWTLPDCASAFQSAFPNLTTLKLRIDSVRDGALLAFCFTAFPKLRSISLIVEDQLRRWDYHETYDEPRPAMVRFVQEAQQRIRQQGSIKRLSIKFLYCEELRNEQTMRAFWDVIAATSGSLEYLKLNIGPNSYTPSVQSSTNALKYVLPSLKTLYDLRVSVYVEANADILADVIGTFAPPSLKRLHLQGCFSQKAIAFLRKQLSSVEYRGSGISTNSHPDVIAFHHVVKTPQSEVYAGAEADQAVCSYCQSFMLAKDLASHLDVCQRRPLPCCNRGLGCTFVGSDRRELEKHMTSECSLWSVPCFLCGECVPRREWESHMRRHCDIHERSYARDGTYCVLRNSGCLDHGALHHFPSKCSNFILLCPYCRCDVQYGHLEQHLQTCAAAEYAAARGESIQTGRPGSRLAITIGWLDHLLSQQDERSLPVQQLCSVYRRFAVISDLIPPASTEEQNSD